MSIREWNSIISQLDSGVIKERTDSILRFKEFLTFTRNFNAICVEPSHTWINTLQSLFGSVLTERNIYAAKPTAAALKRLENSTMLVRWIIEKIHLRLNKKTIKACINHLTQSIAVHGEVQVYALTYLRTLRLLLLHPPHLEHLDGKQWTDIVVLSFAAVLGDKIKTKRELEDDEKFYNNDQVESDSEDEARNKQSRSTLRKTLEETEEEGLVRKTVSQEEIEFVGCIEACFRSKSAPFQTYSAIIFTKFVRFFRRFPIETTAHAPAIIALNRAFAELDLNDQKTMRELGPLLWPAILNLWGSKNSIVKEQVVMAHRYLFPFVAPVDVENISLMIESKIKPLYQAILSEPTIRWRDGYELDIDTLDLGWVIGQEERRKQLPFHSETFCIGVGFSDRNAVAWTILELGADSLFKLYSLSEATPPLVIPPPEELEATDGRKRRKVDEPLSDIIDLLDSPALKSVACFRLQVILFLVERHWNSLHLEISKRILKSTISLLTNDDLQVQSWALLIVAAIARLDSSADIETSNQWNHVWTIAMRRLTNPSTCRTAAHLANILLEANKIESSIITTSIETFCRDIDVQGPSFPSDSVCAFFTKCLIIASNDVRLFRLRLHEKVFLWLSTTWKPLDGIIRSHTIGQARPHADPFSPHHLVKLISRICGIDKTIEFPPTRLVPDCAIATMAIDICETSVIRAYIEAEVPPYSKDHSSNRSSTTTSITTASFNNSAGIERRVSAYFERMMNGMLSESDDLGLAYWSTMNSDSVRRHLDLVSVVLVVEGLFGFNLIHASDSAINSACSLLSDLAPTLAFRKWRSDERASILAGLDLLFVPFHYNPSVDYPTLLDPGVASGIPQHLLPKRSHQSRNFDLSSFPFLLLRTIWEKVNTTQALEEIEASLSFIISGVESAPSANSTQNGATQRAKELEEAQEDDQFGEIKISKASQLSTLATSERAESIVTAFCVRGLITGEMAKAQAGVSIREPRLVDALVNSNLKEKVIIAEQVFNAVLCGLLSFRLGEAESILQRIGEDLERYECARDERSALVALQFLECTASNWILQDAAANEFGHHCRQLCAFYVSNLLHKRFNSWRVRLRFAAFLDKYLSIDRSQSRWALTKADYMEDDDQNLDEIEAAKRIEDYMTRTSEGTILYPTTIITKLLDDDDFRVRFRMATSAPQLFSLYKENRLEDTIVYKDIKSNSRNDPDIIEHMLTSILCTANIVIASAINRRATYHFLIRISEANPLYSAIIPAVLGGVAKRLGLKNQQELYKIYSRSFAHSRVDSGGAPPEPKACGYSSLSEMRRVDFIQAGSIYFAHKMDNNFDTLCEVLNLPVSQVALQCLPDTIAITILRSVAEEIQEFNSNHLENQLEAFVLKTGSKNPREIIKSMSADIAASILAFIHQGSYDVMQALQSENEKYLKIFSSIFNSSGDFYLVGIPTPTHKLLTVVRASIWFNEKYECLSNLASLHSVLQRLLALTRQAPFCDLQKRYLISIGLALSISTSFSTTILSTLTRSLIFLLPQVDLAKILDSMLRWSFTNWIKLQEQDETTLPDLCECLVRAAYATKELNESARGDSSLENVVSEFYKFLNGSIKKLDGRTRKKNKSDIPDISVLSSLFLWPISITDSSHTPLSLIEQVLASSFAPLGKLTLIKAIRAQPNITSDPLSKQILWNLLAATGDIGPESIKDCLGLADFLYDLGGESQSPTLSDEVIKTLQRPAPVELDSDLQRIIVSKVFKFADDQDIELVEIVNATLKSIFTTSTLPESLFDAESLSSRALGVANLLSSQQTSQLSIDQIRFIPFIYDLQMERWTALGKDYDKWIKEFSTFLTHFRGAKDSFYYQLHSVLDYSSEIAITLLPLLVHSTLQYGIDEKSESCKDSISDHFIHLLSDKSTHIETIRTVVKIVLYLRNFPSVKARLNKLASNDTWLNIPWTLLAEGAVKSGFKLAGLLFLELAHEYDNLFVIGLDSQPRNLSLDVKGQDLLYDIYAHIDEPDGFYGKQTEDHREALIRRYHHEERWTEAFGIHGAEYESQFSQSKSISNSNRSSTAGVIQSLAAFGFNRLATSILQPARTAGEILESNLEAGKSYELAWRSATWDLPVEASARGTSSAKLYSALRHVHASRDLHGLKSIVESSLISETSKLATVSLDLPSPNFEVVSTVLALNEIHHWSKIKFAEVLDQELIKKWQFTPPAFAFKHLERLLSTRISLLRSLREHEQVDRLADDEYTPLYKQAAELETICLLQLSRSARHQGQLHTSMNAVTAAYKLITPENSFKVEQEFAKILWDQNEHGTAISLLRKATTIGSDDRVLLKSRLGTWTAEARLESTQEIINKYFDPAVNGLEESLNPSTYSKVYGAYASYADMQLEESEKSTESRRIRFEQYNAKNKLEIEEYEKRLKVEISRDQQNESAVTQLKKGMKEVNAHLEHDRQHLQEAEETTQLLRWQAIQNYAKALQDSDIHDDKIYRFCSLWLAHADNDELHAQLKPFISNISSHKFIALAYQLSARLDSHSKSSFSTNITSLITRMASDHPFHTLYPVESLRESDVHTFNSEPGYNNPSRRQSSNSTPIRSNTPNLSTTPTPQASREKAADNVFQKVKKLPHLKVRVEALELVCKAYREWAMYDMKKDEEYATLDHRGNPSAKKGTFPIRKHMMILVNVLNLPIPVSTFDLPIDFTCKYDVATIPCIMRYESTFSTVGGLAVPKIVICVDNNGKHHKQLLKGKDDIRQDAVMEQAFVLINSLLQKDERARKRNLQIRTYKVIALRGRNGLMEYVQNTKPIGDVLISLYNEYRPNSSMNPASARKQLADAQNKDFASKKRILTKIYKTMPPVMRHAFFKSHTVPSLWFDMRLNYSRSVAVMSMIGHIVGLGDRHVSNILMDEVTGELVAIDLGIAFDAGTNLPIPETVPFRLTPNIVDGFGMTGVDGVFRRSAEETLRVLRDRGSVVMTILDVFKHDPLHKWALSHELIQKLQGSDDAGFAELPDEADRALAVVAEKLETKLSIEYTVNNLIQQATDVDNISRIYHGWSPHL